jgi:predicted AAA+ superfamily ATPase
MILLAGRVGQIVNVSSLADDTGISPNTAESWLSVLEASYVIFRLSPYFKNVSKRLIRSPKIFFYDMGLLCFLLSIDSVKELDRHFARGNIFENLIIAEVQKNKAISNLSSQVYFYRSAKNEEVDLVVDSGKEVVLAEIKSAVNFNQSFMGILLKVNEEIFSSNKNFVIYAGNRILNLKQVKVLPWNKLSELK